MYMYQQNKLVKHLNNVFEITILFFFYSLDSASRNETGTGGRPFLFLSLWLTPYPALSRTHIRKECGPVFEPTETITALNAQQPEPFFPMRKSCCNNCSQNVCMAWQKVIYEFMWEIVTIYYKCWRYFVT